MSHSSWSARNSRGQRGQSLLLLVAALLAVVVGALVIGSVARGLGARASHGSAADLAALAGARAVRDVYPRLFLPPVADGPATTMDPGGARDLPGGPPPPEAPAGRNG